MTKKQTIKKTKKEDAVADAIFALAEAIKGLEAKLDTVLGQFRLIPPKEIPAQPAPATSNAEVVATTVVEPSQSTPAEYPFPFEWRETINTLLNKAFDAKVNYRGDGHFELSIWVPKQYSNAKPNHWESMHEDLRFAVLQNSLGTVGVKMYIEKIVADLGADIMKKVSDDRLNLIRA